LKNSNTEGAVIPLDSVVSESTINNGNGDEETIFVPHQGLLLVQTFSSDELELKLFIDGSTYEINKDAIKSVQSFAIYY
jgi:hypothetical protein